MKSTVSFLVITNITIEIYFSKLLKEEFSECDVLVRYLHYEMLEEVQEDYFSTFDYVIVWLNLEELMNGALINENNKIIFETELITERIWRKINYLEKWQVIWILFEDYFCTREEYLGPIYSGLADIINIDILKKYTGKATFVDFKRLVAECGIECALDLKGKYRWNAIYTKDCIKKVSNSIKKIFLITKNKSPKCLVLDCDNVLWGGVISEDGIENVMIGNDGVGRVYRDFQMCILDLYYHGVILAICSKNDFGDVKLVFNNHTGMLLKEENIALFKVNWESKVDNIEQIAKELNISLESIVFVDDSVFEIEMVNTFLPEVQSVLFKKNNIKEIIGCFNLKDDVEVETILNRNRTYQTNYLRNELRTKTDDYNAYLNKLEMKIEIHKMDALEIKRASELTLRTNKCTNGKRYTTAQIKELLFNEEYELYVVYLSDKFSDLGLVGVLGINFDIIDLVCLSCRALGRLVENKIVEFAIKKNIKKVWFLDSGKNQDFKEMLSDNFEII